jgi:Flp pilus assembly protein TadB
MTSLLIVAGVAGFVFFFVRWLQLQAGYRSMSEIERRYAEIESSVDARDAESAPNLAQRRAAFLNRWGMRDSVLPVVAVLGFFYLAATAILVAVGAAPVITVLAPIPLGLFVVFSGGKVVASRRKNTFNLQLVNMLDLLTGQLRSGIGMDRALVNVLPSLQDPLRAEMANAISVSAAGGDLLVALEESRKRFPSRSFDLFVSLLEIDRNEGTAIAPAMEQASELLKNSFALQSEGRAELSASRTEFYGVLLIVGGLSLNSVINSGGPDGVNPWIQPLGIIILLVLFSNTAFGIWRFTKVIGRLKKETE